MAEVAAIVGSILLAFAIDAWWDAHQARAEEREAILALTGDFEAALDILEKDNLAVHDSALVAGRALLALTGPGEVMTQTRSSADLVGWIRSLIPNQSTS